MTLNVTDFTTQAQIKGMGDVAEHSSPTSVTKPADFETTTANTFNYTEEPRNVYGSWVMTMHIIIAVIAVTGNSLTLCVCMKRVNRKKSFMLYLATLAVFDTINSLTFLPRMIPNVSLGNPEVYCKLSGFIFDSSIYISSWLIVAMSVERTISTKLPHHVAQISTRKFGIKTISIIVIVSFMLNGHLLYGWTGITIGSRVWCKTIPGPYSLIWRYFQPFLRGLFFSLIPGTILILCNGVMIKAVFDSANKIRRSNSGPAAKRNRELLIMTVSVSTIFIILTSPFDLFHIIIAKTDTNSFTDVETQIWAITDILYTTNFSINFFLYVISGSRFRQQLKEMLHCRSRCWN